MDNKCGFFKVTTKLIISVIGILLTLFFISSCSNNIVESATNSTMVTYKSNSIDGIYMEAVCKIDDTSSDETSKKLISKESIVSIKNESDEVICSYTLSSPAVTTPGGMLNVDEGKSLEMKLLYSDTDFCVGLIGVPIENNMYIISIYVKTNDSFCVISDLYPETGDFDLISINNDRQLVFDEVTYKIDTKEFTTKIV